jgi:hypothetical protein
MKPLVLKGVVAALAAAACIVIVAGFKTGPATVIVAPAPSIPTASQGSAPSGTAPAASSSAPASMKAPASAPSAPAAPARPEPTKAQLDAAAASLSAAVVNIICAPEDDNSTLRAISGSGVIIDPRGIILTDAHVGQFFLLAHEASAYAFGCVIRTGSPAEDAYTAAPIYVSRPWIEANSAVITESSPEGTGENDVALLGITGALKGGTLPAQFPYVPLSADTPSAGDDIVIGSYAAQFLSGEGIATDLNQTIVYSTIKQIYTFDTDTVDVLSLGGSIAAQEGSSGGGVVNGGGALAGLITTSTIEGDLTKRDLRALTTGYVLRSIKADTGESIAALLSGTVPNLVEGFSREASALGLILVNQIQHN